MRTFTQVSLALLFIVSLLNISMAADDVPELKEQTLCPVMGGKINKDVYVDHDGQRIFFCCKGCESKFKADPATYLKKIAENGEKPMSLALCSNCGEYKGSEKCCAKDAVNCDMCGKHKGSPGCCADMKTKEASAVSQMTEGKACCAATGTKECCSVKEAVTCKLCGNAAGSEECKATCMKQTS